VHVARQLAREGGCQGSVDFDGDDPSDAWRQRSRQRAATGSDFEKRFLG
jgi:hypothetical protein